MSADILRLYPPPGEWQPLEGTYLAHNLRSMGTTEAPFVYTNFISSLDGRISELDPQSLRRRVPLSIANARDWRLFMELAAQADVLLTTSRHLRAIAAGRHTELILFDAFPDLLQWRADRGLPKYPALAAVTEQLDIPAREVGNRYSGKIYAMVPRTAPTSKIQRLKSEGLEILFTGPGPALDGKAIVRAASKEGWRTVYSIAGPRIAYTLFAARTVERLYLSVATAILAGREFDTLSLGEELVPAEPYHLSSLFLDKDAPPNANQLLAAFDKSR